MLVRKLWRDSSGANHDEAQEALALSVLAFFWQFGNLWRELAVTFDFNEGGLVYEAGNVTRAVVLVGFPLLFSYMMRPPRSGSRVARFDEVRSIAPISSMDIRARCSLFNSGHLSRQTATHRSRCRRIFHAESDAFLFFDVPGRGNHRKAERIPVDKPADAAGQ